MALINAAIIGQLIKASNKPSTAGGGGYTANSTTLDGLTNTVKKNSNLTGLSNTNVGCISFWVKFNGGDGNTMYIIDNGASHFFVKRVSDGTLAVQGFDTGGTRILDIEYTGTSTFIAGTGYHHVMCGWNASAGYMLVNGSSANVTVFTLPGATAIDYGGGSVWNLGADGPGGSHGLNGCISELWFASQDVASSVNSAFESGGHPKSLGSDGSTPTGTAPQCYLKNPFGTFGTNSGTGGDFDQTDGTLSSCTAP